MCDDSLLALPNRLAREFDRLVVHHFPTVTLGLVAALPQPQTPPVRRWWCLLTILTVVVGPQAALGAGSTSSVSATYTVLRDTEAGKTFERGISLGGACRIHRWLFVAAEGAFSRRHEDYSSSAGGTYDFYYQSFQAGPRASPLSGRVRPYGELLVGVTRLGIWERRLDRTGAWGSPEVSMQPGVGLDLQIARRVSVRLAGDVRELFRHDNRFDRDYRTRLYRVNAGVAFHFGGS